MSSFHEICIEGNDGTGKSTLVAALKAMGYRNVSDRGIVSKLTLLESIPQFGTDGELYFILQCSVETSLQRLRNAGKDMNEVWHTEESLTHFASKFQTHANRDLVGMICSVAHKNGMKTQVGGGIRSLDAIRETLSFSEKVVVGSLAVHDPQVVVEGCNLYPGRVVVALDCRGDCVSVKGWVSDTMMLPEDAYEPFRGIADVLMTQVHVEGSGAGPDFELYRRFLSAYPDCAVQASGGIRNDSDVNMLYRLGVSHVILGRALYEGALHCEV